MKTKCFLTLLISFLCIGSLSAQRTIWSSFSQSIDVEAYQNKKFRFSGAVRVIIDEPDHHFYFKVQATLFARVDKKDKKRGFFDGMNNRPIHRGNWKVYTISGTIDEDGDKLNIGGTVKQGGLFYFDAFKLEIELSPGQWKEIPIKNPGFEEWTLEGKPKDWNGRYLNYVNFLVFPSEDELYEGKYALMMKTDGYKVAKEHPQNEIFPKPYFEWLTIDDQIPSYGINCFYQDRQGLIWMGTGEGLVRYDGHGYKLYQKDPADSLSLSANDVSVIYEDRKAQLWIGTLSGGVNLFDRHTELFKRYQHRPGDSLSLTNNQITTIYEDREGYIWMGGHKSIGLNRLDPKTDKCKQFLYNSTDPFGFQSNWVIDIKEDHTGRLWLGTYANGLIWFERETEKFHKFFTMEKLSSGKASQYILSIEVAADGMLWLACEGGLLRFDPEKKEFIDYYRVPKRDEAGKMSNIFFSSAIEPSGALWLSYGNGITRFDPKLGQFQSYTQDQLGTSRLMLDKEGIVWFGTSKGLARINPYKTQFFTHPISNILPDKLATIKIDGPILEDSENLLWVRTEEGLYRLNLNNGKGGFYEDEANENFSLKNNYIQIMSEDHQQNIWFGFSNYGLNKWDRSLGKIVPIGTLGLNGAREIASIFEDSQQTLWLGTWGGVWHFDRENPGYKRISWRQEDGKGRAWTRASEILEDRDGNIWVGTHFGELKRFLPEKKFFKDFTPAEIDTKVDYGENAISDLHLDKKGNIWMGTFRNGIRQLDVDKGSYHHYTKKDGLANNSAGGILEDELGRLWISTANGLSSFNPDNKSFQNFNVHDGLPSNELGHIHKGKNSGAFYIGTSKGLIVFHPDSIRQNTQVPPIVISSLHRYNKEDNSKGEAIEVKGVSEKSDIRLSYQDDLLNFKFAALSYSKSGNNQYAYRLVGLSNQWIQLGTKKEVTFTNLPPGNYTLQVKGSNGDGVWNEEGTSLGIHISPPWYWAWWSKLLYAIAALSALYGWYLWRTQEQRKQLAFQEKELAHEQLINARLKEIDKIKDQFLANTSHELRTPLHGIIGISESLFKDVANKSVDDLQQNLGMIMASGRRLASLVNDLLDFSRAKNHDIQLKEKSLDLHSAVETVLHSCQPLIGQAPVTLENGIPKDLPAINADDNRLQQILFNLIGNAIKFTQEGSVRISAQQKARMVEICIQDTGVGIAAEDIDSIFQSFEQGDGSTAREYGGTGLGLSITKQLVELHGGKIWVESTAGKGSKFYFTLAVSDKPTQLQNVPEAVVTPISGITDIKLSIPLAGSAEDRIKILVVDDEPINHQVLRNYLTEDQYMLTSVMNGKEALEAIKLGVKFDLVLLDVMMPRISGYEVCQKIREKYLPSELPVIMVTAKNQIQDLVNGLSVGANDYLAKPFSRDEFLARVKTQLELHRINETTNKFVPIEFLRALGRDRITEVKLGDYAQKDITVMFSDIRDYTSLSENMTPEENYLFVNAFNGRMGPIIQQHDGFVNQYLGDAIMALFTQKPSGALKSAIEMQKVLRDYNRERVGKNRKIIQMGLGLHTGALIMGIIGDKDRMDAATISDAVNTASRIENLTKYFGTNILLSEDTLNKLYNPEDFNCRHLGKVQVKGKKDTIGIYECIDGDHEKLQEKKLASMAQFEMAMDYFFSKEFAEASLVFHNILKTNPEDMVVKMFLDKSAQYIQRGVPENWTGVEVMYVK